ncbi:MAG: ABC-F family ATP-binding cassette domain-containing protein [Opitutales bacterium]|jgi:ATP-binding cassette subfamily F protein 3
MLALENISLQFGEKTLFDGIEARIGARDRIGLVGANGAGKTTLFRIVMGEAEPDTGDIDRASYVTLGYLPQETLTLPGRSVYNEAAAAFEDVHVLRRRLDEADHRLHELDPNESVYAETLQIIGEIEHRLEDLEAEKMKARVEKVLLGLGFSMADMNRDCGEFSGGWQMRIALARLLLREPSLLLLDEPTNHLDLDSLRWLERYLQNYEGAIILISHDRAFLDGLCNRIFHLTHSRLDAYRGNYSSFEEQAAARYEQLVQAQKSQARSLAQTERFIERFRFKASKARQVQSRIKALDRVDRIEVDQKESSLGNFKFPPPERCANDIFLLKKLVKRYGEQVVIKGVDLEITRGERIAIVGVNGAGKSTLTRVLAGVEPFEEGTMKIGDRVNVAYFAQHQSAQLDPEKSVMELAAETASDAMRNRVRDILGSFLFSGGDVMKPAKVLSGGEKNRLALVRILLRPTNCLILDEPTNHLDMDSKAMLQEALTQWEGTMIIVSHDREFLDPIVNRVLEVSPGKVRSFPGNVSEYIEKIDAERAAAGPAANAGEPAAQRSMQNPKERRRIRAEKQKEITPVKKEADAVEARIAEMEKTVALEEAAMVDPVFFKSPSAPARMRALDKMQTQLDADMQRWEKLLTQLERLQAELAELDAE